MSIIREEIILVVEDDEGLNRGICFTLEKEGYPVLSAKSYAEGIAHYSSNKIGLILLDVNLPDKDGLEFCSEIRKTSNLPIIMLTARDLETDEVIGFEAGADDYITKPFSLSVLKARISAMLRRSATGKEELPKNELQWINSGNVSICKDNCKVFLDGEEIALSVTEYKLLRLFIEHKNQLLRKEQILGTIWDADANFVDENTLPVNIRRLRKKLEEDPSKPKCIMTVHGMGYLWKEGADHGR